MARQALADDEKRKQVAVRLGPRDRLRIETIAEQSGNSLGAEVEQLALDQLAYLEATDLETRLLLGDILTEIEAIQKATGKRWHKDLSTWSAVMEMLRQGPIASRNPDPTWDDDAVRDAFGRLHAIEQKKRELCARLAEIGVSVTAENPAKRKPAAKGLLGSFANANALAGYSLRITERAAINKLPDGPDKARAFILFAEVEELDIAEQTADAEWTETLRPYWDAKARGRDLYRTMLRRRAEDARASGKPFDYNHLTGWFD